MHYVETSNPSPLGKNKSFHYLKVGKGVSKWHGT